MVVSLIGLQWSPNTPPDSEAATKAVTGRPSAVPIGTAIGSMIAKVPQLLPVPPLDGGRVLRAALWAFGGSFQNADELANAIVSHWEGGAERRFVVLTDVLARRHRQHRRQR